MSLRVSVSACAYKRVCECVTDIQMLSKLKTEIKEYEEAFYQQTRRIDNKLIELIDLCNKGKNLLQQVIVNNLKMYNNGEFSELITKTIKRHSDEDVELIFVLPDFFYSKDCQQYIKDFKYDEYYLFQLKYPKAVFSYNTALYFYEMTERTPIKMDVTVYREYNPHRFKDFVNVYKISKELYNFSSNGLY